MFFKIDVLKNFEKVKKEVKNQLFINYLLYVTKYLFRNIIKCYKTL